MDKSFWNKNTESEPAPNSDEADVASTDMSAEPSSRAADSQADFAPDAGVLVEPAAEAIRRLEDELAAAQDRHLRLAAEYDNFRKRTTKERAELHDRGQAAVVARLLDVLDDMDRMAAAAAEASPEALREAATLVNRKFRKELDAAGLERIDPVGSPFDPTLHEAVSTAAAASPEQDHVVSATFQIGYRFKGTLIRPARVQVFSVQEPA